MLVVEYCAYDIIHSCLKNCMPATKATNSRISTVMRAYCVSNCEKVSNDSYTWSHETVGGSGSAPPTAVMNAKGATIESTEFYDLKPDTIGNGGSVKVILQLKGLCILIP